MFRNCLAAAWRNAFRDRLYFPLNVLGLGLGFALMILAGLFVRDELSFNSVLPGYRDVYWVRLTIADGGQPPTTVRSTPARLAAELKLDFPEIVAATRTRAESAGLRHGTVEAVESIMWVDPDFFAVLSFPLLRGDPATALAAPDSVVLTRSLALKYFGTVDCLGQVLDVDHRHGVRVTGVAEDPPANVSETFSVLLSGETAWGKLAVEDATPLTPGVLSLAGETFVRLRPGTDPAPLAARLAAFPRAHYPDPDGPEPLFASLFLRSLADVHLHPFNPDTHEPNSRERTLAAVAATGVIIAVLAGINFVNLVTARASRRAVEIGVRKAQGALRSQLFVQFVGEAVGYALAGLVIGVALAACALPRLNALLDRAIAVDFWRDPVLVMAPIGVAILFGLLAGAYPAVVLSGLPAARALQAKAGGSLGGGRLRLALVVIQFTTTIALLIATTVIHRQIAFANAEALGFDTSLMLTIDLTGMPETPTADGLGRRDLPAMETLRARLAGLPGVRGMAGTFTLPQWANFLRADIVGPAQTVTMTIQPVDVDFFGLYRVPLLAGRDFSPDRAEDKVDLVDKARISSVVINQTAMRALGFADPAAAIGQTVRGSDPSTPHNHRIVGVVPDFPLDSIRDPVPPSLFLVDPGLFKVLDVKLSAADLPETLRAIDATWHDFVPQRPIHRAFLDDQIAGLYLDMIREGQMFATFAGCAVAIGCLGLFGLSAFTAERRTKEIGIRKAMGASAFDVSWLLVRQLTRPVLIANLVAWPVAWWFMHGWLDGFAYRVDLGPAPFLIAGLETLVIAGLTTAFHAVQVARAHPVSALRYE